MSDDDLSSPEGWRAKKVEEFAKGNLSAAADAMLALTYYDHDRLWVESFLVAAVDSDADIQIRRLAVTCLGHVARIHGAIGADAVAAVRQALQDPELSGIAEDAMGDIESFTS
jgi:hypothetical protein